ncbi:hypothetical protein M747DRAFT_330427 [Aspergillus niger ATCC 13496]|uniref:Contig An12c0360, genomic contig n=5 Tax=Aspergillus subgen. Circumdati TaxID=2720871 RepID=A2R103_ASPNC|nr:uncharacterized protein An12g10460 [Aspergillus niger]RDH22013.1 hypothetical protein M747DRAFT_330427 [Aspergillus niger ATCC 13496]CAK41393.1 unnamed protein product [Aspergillus niger]
MAQPANPQPSPALPVRTREQQRTRRKRGNVLDDRVHPNTSTALQPVRRQASRSPSPATDEESILAREQTRQRARGDLAKRDPAGQEMTQPSEEEDTGLKLRLELNLDVEVELKAKIHGDLTLALLTLPFEYASMQSTNSAQILGNAGGYL